MTRHVLLLLFSLVSLASGAQTPDFIRGADVSTLLAVERAGGRFFDLNGQPGDALVILKTQGINWIRLRLWNDPAAGGDPGGGNDLATDLVLAKRAKALGLRVLLDFHYSDTWADPSRQTLPRAWAGLGPPALERAVYEFTRQTLETLAGAGAAPDMVQLGNETNGGMLWPWGKTYSSTPDEPVGGFDGFAALLAQGVQAVREACPSVPVAVHLAGADGSVRYLLDELTKRAVDFDLIGVSYYPYWHGSLADLAGNLAVLGERYRKPLLILETAYAASFVNSDATPNLFGPEFQRRGGYPASPQGQEAFLRDLFAVVASVPGDLGRGVFYWEPAWIPVEGAGWKAGEGNAWENQALFDPRGRALPALSVYRPPSGVNSR